MTINIATNFTELLTPSLDLAELLAPITKKNPAGANLRKDSSPSSPYYKLKDARAAARTSERQKMLGAQGQSIEGNVQDRWVAVQEMSVEILKSKSKDLEIVAWLIEALLRTHGFAGLRDGFILAGELIKLYWDGIYPQVDEEDGVVARIAPFVGLNGGETEGTLIVPMANVLLTEGVSKGPYTFWQYHKAREIEVIQDPTKKQQRIEQSGISMECFNAAVAETSKTFYKDLMDDLGGCIKVFADFSAILDERCAGVDALQASHIRNKLRDSLECVKTITNGMQLEEEVAVDISNISDSKQESQQQQIIASGVENSAAFLSLAQAQQVNASTAKTSAEILAAKDANLALEQILNREQALHMLLKIAQFFRETEPHSPLPHILERAVRWGRMPLLELLNEIIADPNARDRVRELIGAVESADKVN